MRTTDGCTITTIEQDGDYAGHDVGRIWIHNRHRWTVDADFASEAERQAIVAQAQTMTAAAFDTWFDTASENERTTHPGPGQCH